MIRSAGEWRSRNWDSNGIHSEKKFERIVDKVSKMKRNSSKE